MAVALRHGSHLLIGRHDGAAVVDIQRQAVETHRLEDLQLCPGDVQHGSTLKQFVPNHLDI